MITTRAQEKAQSLHDHAAGMHTHVNLYDSNCSECIVLTLTEHAAQYTNFKKTGHYMTTAQTAAVARLDESFGGHGDLFDESFARSDGQPPAVEGWFGRSDPSGTLIPTIFAHIEPDGSVHT